MGINISNLDRIIRFVLAAIVIALYFLEIITGTTAIVLGVIAAILLITGAVNFCPLYHLFGISTCRVPK